MKNISYAQNFEDVMLARALADVESGFYVDVGAQDPLIDSVTRRFYERGWSGINIEPVPHWFERLQAERPRDTNLMCAVASTPGTLVIHESVDSGLSTANEDYARGHKAEGRDMRERVVPARRLDDILIEHAPTVIHFLKIDVEGLEADVLASLSLERCRPWILVIEATRPNTDIDVSETWEASVLAGGYRLVYRDGLNRFYLAEEHMSRASAFAVPPNVFDDFIHYREYASNEFAKSLEGRIHDLHDTASRLRGDLATVGDVANAQQIRLAELNAVLQERQTVLDETARQAEAWREALTQAQRDLRTVAETAENRRVLAEQLDARIRQADQQLRQLAFESHAASIHAAALRGELERVYSSRSWRMTAPVRALGRRARSAIGRVLRVAAGTPLLRSLGGRVLTGRLRERVLRIAGFGGRGGEQSADGSQLGPAAEGARRLSRAATRVYGMLEQSQGQPPQGVDEDSH